MDKKRTTIDVYLSTVYKWGLIMLSCSAMCAAVTFNVEKFFGLYPTIPWISAILLWIMDCVFLAVAVYLIKISRDEDGYLRDGKIKVGKMFATFIIIVQWNYLLYMVPTRTFWGFLFFFLILLAFFLDIKMLLFNGIACMLSLFIAWSIRGSALMPVKDELFLTDLLLCVMALVLSLAGLLIFVFFVSHFLVNAQTEALEKNIGKVKNLLYSVQQLSDGLQTTGVSLSQVSEREKASAENLAATSLLLMESSNLLNTKTDESMTNLSELSQCEEVMAENIEKVKSTSKNLLDKSVENSRLLGNLHAINDEVSDSMRTTIEVAGKLSDAVQQIGVTLNLINEISTSTNLLALNASIEAARAGEAGRGFAVVASEVGTLANSTRASLQEVETVIERVMNNMSEITYHVEENSQKLNTQNEYFDSVFKGIQDMTDLLNMSVKAVNTMGEAHNKQSEVIRNTVSINKDITESIRNENEQFHSINTMAENNANDTTELASQASRINEMVNEMTRLLNTED